MSRLTAAFCLVLLLLAACASPRSEAPVDAGPDDVTLAEARERVKAEFLHAWHGYRSHAWGYDDLKPLSKSGHNWYDHAIYTTPVDAMSTMLLMGLQAEADSTVQFVAENLSFDHDMSVQVFEITIRHLGGLLSAYQMTGDERLLDLAEDLGTRLLPAFESATGLPYRYVNLRTGEVRDGNTNPAESGTLLIEFGTLSKLTGDPVFYDTAKRALVAIFERRSDIGLVGTSLDVETGEWTNGNSSISAYIDSYYEYLLKCAILFDDADCRAMWEASIPAVTRFLADTTDTGLWHGHADMNTGERTATAYGALDAFWPGVLALSGDVEQAEALQASSFTMWNLHGIEPERFDYAAMEVASAAYPLRPEIVESAYILHHYTGDVEYRTMGLSLFDDFVRYCRTDAGYATLASVVTKEQADEQQSFLFAETFKYYYLLFSPADVLDYEGVVFNTEAHPIRRTW